MGRIPVNPAWRISEWKTNRPMATRMIAEGKICQKSLKENSVTELVIGTGPVRVMVRPRSSHVQRSVPAAVPSALNSHGRSSWLIRSRRLCVFSMISFAGLSSVTAMAMMARSRVPSASPSAPSVMSRASLSRPGVGVPSSSYISPMTRSMVV